MSWEELSNSQYKCPCGSGTFTIRFFTDDWNRTEERWEMDCPICRQNYRLYTYFHHDLEMTSSSFIWAKKEQYEDVERIGAQLTQAKEDVVKAAASSYMNEWLLYFSDARSKKEIWRRLTDNGMRYPSLSTFYAQTRHTQTASYLQREFSYNNVPIILHKLGVGEEEITERLRIARDIEAKHQKAINELMRNGFRKLDQV